MHVVPRAREIKHLHRVDAFPSITNAPTHHQLPIRHAAVPVATTRGNQRRDLSRWTTSTASAARCSECFARRKRHTIAHSSLHASARVMRRLFPVDQQRCGSDGRLTLCKRASSRLHDGGEGGTRRSANVQAMLPKEHAPTLRTCSNVGVCQLVCTHCGNDNVSHVLWH
jgi:hypothetical protein